MGRHAPGSPGSLNNRVLNELPASAIERIAPHLEPAAAPAGTVLMSADEVPSSVLFVESGLCSLITLMRDGHGVECAAVGPEGMVGVGTALCGRNLPSEVVSYTPVSLFRLPADVFAREMARDPAVREVVTRYVHRLLVQVMQSVACSRLHGLEERCCRWLLMAFDRLQTNRLDITQERLAASLGVRRPSLTIVANGLQRAGLIAYRRGHLQLLDRQGLERAACECYRAVHTHLERLGPES